MVTPEEIDKAEQDFLAGGFARSNFELSETWTMIHLDIESFSDRWTKVAWKNGSRGYPWPLDPLNWWSRLWEYAFVSANLDPVGGTELLNVGAAVTFFDAWMESKGWKVTRLDAAKKMQKFAYFAEAANQYMIGSRLGPYRVADVCKLGDAFESESFNRVVCLSVLEHIPNWSKALYEMIRVLIPGGKLILTVDVNRNPGGQGFSAIAPIIEELERFDGELITDSSLVVPSDCLESEEWNLRCWGGVWQKR